MFIKFKRLMSALLCCAMLFGMLPVNAFATENSADTGIVLEENVAEVPTESVPSDQKSEVEEPLVEQPEAEEPVAEEPVVEEPVVEGPVVEEPVIEEPVVNEPVVEEPVVDEPVIEEPVVNEPVVDAPVTEEPEVEEPAADESETEEPEEEIIDFGFESSVPTLAADTPQMPYYNDSNYVAYDVENTNGSGGANDANGTYVQSVTLGGVAVTQANSNDYYADGERRTNHAGSTLSSYYPGVDTNDNNVSKALVITPAPGYYVSRIVVACCDLGNVYQCGTWRQGITFTASFDVNTGGALTTTLPSSAFGHGVEGNYYSRNGGAQYFILIKVAPVPKPLYVAYDYGNIDDILGSDFAGSPFTNSNAWTAVGNGNNYGTGGSNETPYTQFKYYYQANSEVGNWRHVSNSVTEAAKLAAAAKGYYFTGWKATYYNNCSSRYQFDNVYSEATELIGEGVDVRLITHAKLVAQWAPVKMTVQKVVEGLNTVQNHTINVLKNNGAFDTVTFRGSDSKVYSPVVPGTYSVTEEGANQRVEIGGKKYNLTTTYSDPVAITAAEIAAGNQKAVSLIVTNTYEEVTTIEVTATKVWDDADNGLSTRPDSVMLQLYANGEAYGEPVDVTADSGWSVTWNDLDRDATYTVDELDVPAGYEKVSVTGNAADGFVVTNKYKNSDFSSQFGSLIISGQKIWDDNNNEGGVRPDSLTVYLKADGEVIAEQTISEETGWKWSFDLSDGIVDKTVADFENVEFTIEEDAIENYIQSAVTQPTVSFTYPETADWVEEKNCSSLDISVETNEKTVIIAKKGHDYWLWSQSPLAEIERDLIIQSASSAYSIPKTASGYNYITGLGTSSDVGMTVTQNQVTFSRSSNWSWLIHGTYVPGSTTSDGGSLTNTMSTTSITVSKVWKDNDDQDGIRPDTVTINLLADGTVIDTATVSKATDWAYEFTDLKEYKNGQKITYTVKEIDVPKGYTSAVEGNVITNTHAPEKTSVTVTKEWKDNDNQDGIRPNDVTIQLLANGEDTGKTLVLNAGNNWTGSFTELDKYAAGDEIEYTIEEIAVEGYETAITGDMNTGYTVTNSHTPAVVEVSGAKTWNDADNQDGTRPESITINLLADGKVIKTVTVTEEDKWSWSFENLPKYKGQGTTIVYSITEDAVEDYTTTYNGFNVINTHTPEKTSVTVTKAWADADNQDGIRPNDVTIKLLAGGNDTGKTLVLNVGNNWTGSFTELDKYAAGDEIEYTIEEIAVEGYETAITGDMNTGYTVTNSHTPAVVEVSGAKTWNDADNQDGARPESITINLVADGEVIKTVSVTEEDKWSWSFENLPKYKGQGTTIVYSITEDAVEDYTTTYNGFNVINTHTPEKTSVTVTKAWADADNQDGIRPNDVTIKLLAGGNDTGKTLVLNAGNNWTGSFTELDKYAAGDEIEYTIEEIAVEGYETAITGDMNTGYTVTNSHTPAVVEVSGAKTWNDADNQDGARPESITINLVADGEVIKTVSVTEEDEWSWSFENLPKHKDHGTVIVYAITENIVEEYSTTYNGYNVTNSYTPKQTSVTVTKAWNDNGDQDGLRPDSVTIQLLANGEDTGKTLVLNAGNNWTGSFTELDQFENGKEIVYKVNELTVTGYTTVIAGDQATGYTVTNTHEPETLKVSGAKTWDDADNQDGKRPASITINLLADGNVIATKNVVATDNWSWSFEDLPKYRDHGTLIAYTINEAAVEDYTTTYNGFNVINTHTPEQTSVKVTKEWNDKDNQDGIRSKSVTIQLLANGADTGKTLVLSEGNNWTGTFADLDKYAAGEIIAYTVKELTVTGYTSVITGSQADGYTVTNTHTPEVVKVSGVKIWKDNDDQDGARPESITINLVKDGEVVATKTVTAANGWSWSFDDLPKYENQGVEIIYTITETAVEDYTTTYNGFNVINTHTPEQTSVTVTKAWKDAGDQDGIRPNDVTIKLLADGKATGKTLILSEGNGWTGSFTDLDKFANGKEIAYTVEELTVTGYTSVITGTQATGYTVTNTHEPETLEVSGKKTWDDADDQDGKRPESITIRLLASGLEVKNVTVTEADNWAWSFKDLPKYENHGTEIIYTVTEDSIEGYTATIDGFNVTNKYTPEETSLTVTKSWQDNNDQDGIRPEKITVNLLANGEKAASAQLTAEGNWTYTFTALDVYAQGKQIVYTVEEESVEGYETAITGDASKGFTVTNSHTPEVVEVAGKKTWDDDNNRDGKRPASITVRLLANGKEVAVATVTADNAWAYKFTDLPKFEAGKEIVYTVTEDAVEGYSVQYSGDSFDITNKYTPGKTSITVTKRWIDGGNHDGIRPSSVTIYLYANDVKVASMKLTAKDNWTGVFEDLHVYENGKAIEYTISEKSVRGYNATFTGNAEQGFTVTNTHNIIPKTGDDSNLPLYVSLFGTSISALAVLMFLAKPRKKGKYAR